MDYYRKAAAVFILIITLILPFYLEVEAEVAVVEIDTLLAESQYLSQKSKSAKDLDQIDAELMGIIKKTAAEYAQENNYSSVVSKHLIYRGGQDISIDLAQKIDAEN